MSIKEKGLLVSINISLWAGRKLDRKITAEVNSSHGAGFEAGHYNKYLMADGSLKELTKLAGSARTEFYNLSLPWTDEGWRLVTNQIYFDLIAKLNQFKSDFEKAVESFISNYEDYKAQSKQILNGLYNEADYPDSYALAKKFSFDIKFRAIDDAQDFRTELCNEEAEKIRASIQATTNNAIKDAMASIYCKLQKSIDCLAAKMLEGTKYKDPIFRDSIIENIRDICDVIPRLNITGDKNLELLGIEVQNKLASIQPESLRESPELRKETAKTASEISNKISQYMGAM